MYQCHCNLMQFKPPLVTAERNTGKYNNLSPKSFYERAPMLRGKTMIFVPRLYKTRGDCQSKTHIKIHILQLGIYMFFGFRPNLIVPPPVAQAAG